MKIIEGQFGKKKEEQIKASQLFKILVEAAEEIEAQELDVKAAAIVFVNGEQLQVVSNDTYPDATYMLFNMAAQSIMMETLGVTE